MSRVPVLYLVAAVFAIIGGIFTAIGAAMTSSTKRRRQVCTQLCMATVADMQREVHHDDDGANTVTWHPIYAYTFRGISYRKRSTVGHSRPQFEIGERLELLIDPTNPEVYYTPREKRETLAHCFLGIGIALLLFAAAALFLCCKPGKRLF